MSVQEFLNEYVCHGEQKFIGGNWDSNLVSYLINLSDSGVEFVGGIKKEMSSWKEFYILYRFPKTTSIVLLGSYLKLLGNIISGIKLKDYDFGIQEVDVTRPIGYYILVYGLEK